MTPAIAAAADLTGGWSWTVWLLIPVALVAAYVTARVLGRDGEPPASTDHRAGVMRRVASDEGRA